MAHYAFLNDDNIVVEVITGVDESELIEGLSPETWYANFRGLSCKRTSYNTYVDRNGISQHANGGTPFRGIYAGIGYTYDAVTDTFTPPPTPEVDL